MSEPKDERFVKTEIEVSSAHWLPASVRGGIVFQRLWDKRSTDYVLRSARAGGVDPAELLSRAEQGDEFSDVFAKAGRKYVEHGDSVYQDTLMRLVAAALHDDARISETSYILDKLESMKPLHIRLVVALPRDKNGITAHEAAVAASVSPRLGAAGLAELQLAGFAHESNNLIVGIGSRLDRRSYSGPTWTLTDLGQSLLDLIDEIDSPTGAPG